MSFMDVAFYLPELVFIPHFLKFVIEVKVSKPPHVL